MAPPGPSSTETDDGGNEGDIGTEDGGNEGDSGTDDGGVEGDSGTEGEEDSVGTVVAVAVGNSSSAFAFTAVAVSKVMTSVVASIPEVNFQSV